MLEACHLRDCQLWFRNLFDAALISPHYLSATLPRLQSRHTRARAAILLIRADSTIEADIC